MKILLITLMMFSMNAFSARVECTASEHKIVVESMNPADLKVTFRGETVLADGILDNSEVDLVARFKSVGELTLFAKVGKASPENYLFIQSKRFSVICR